MVLLSLLCVSAFTWSASSGASIVHNFNTYTEESPTKSVGGFGWKESNRISGVVGKKGRTPRILNGEEATVGEFPWMASIHRDGAGHQCGGSIISRTHILTAAHCIPKNLDELSQLTVLVGGHFQDRSREPRAQEIKVKMAILHVNFGEHPAKNDIAILVLEKEIELNNYTAIINLPSREYLFGNVAAKAAGWGSTHGDRPFDGRNPDSTFARPLAKNAEYNSVSPTLKVTNLTIFNNTDCHIWHDKWINYQVNISVMCAGASDLKGDDLPGDTMKGDSGGPLFLQENGKWVVVGITSSTFSNPGRPLPGIYTRVSEYLLWIKEQMMKTEALML